MTKTIGNNSQISTTISALSIAIAATILLIHIEHSEANKSIYIHKKTQQLRFKPAAWHDAIAISREDTKSKEILTNIIRQGQTISNEPIIKRAYNIKDIPANILDKRTNSLKKNAEIFALAKQDLRDTRKLQSNMEKLSIAFLATRDEQCLQKIVEQLSEVSTWKPLQRPGWSLVSVDKTLPPGGDGSWLATGYGIWSLVDTLSLLKSDLPSDLVNDLTTLIECEATNLLKDYKQKKQWFLKAKGAPASNQWVTFFSALVYASLFLEDDKFHDAYEIGVQNLVLTMNNLGTKGDCLEGSEYAEITADAIFRSTWAMKRIGDTRLATHPFTKKFSHWYIQMFMPGYRLVNAYDCRRYKTGSTMPTALALASFDQIDEQTAWISQNYFENFPQNAIGLMYAYNYKTFSVEQVPPPKFEYFPSSQILTWRSNWNPATALALWIRGATSLDSHSHRDTGHISIYNGNENVLIDCGRNTYDTPLSVPGGSKNAGGHNVLQFGAKPSTEKIDAIFSINQIDDNGGEITIDATSAYDQVNSWIRKISWNSTGIIKISDSIEFKATPPANTELLRYHLGNDAKANLVMDKTGWQAQYEATAITFASSAPVNILQSLMEDHAGSMEHTCLCIFSTIPTKKITISTSLKIPLINYINATQPNDNRHIITQNQIHYNNGTRL